MQTDDMIAILQDAYAHPEKPNVFYSANSAPVTVERLRDICWDWTPQRSVGVEGNSTCVLPLSLGCPPIRTSEDKEWIAPLMTDPQQVHAFTVPDVWEGRTGVILRALEEKVRTLPEGQRVREPDIQSPLGIAELMWDDSFYTALLDSPREVHLLLEKITDFTIRYIQEIHRVVGTRLNGAGFPLIWGDAQGTMIADDSMSLISPAMHREFSLPYVNAIADACGPLYYHSCTWREAYFDNIHAIHNVRAYNWNPGNSDDPARIIAEFSGEAVLVPHIVSDMHRDNDLLRFSFTDEAALLAYMLEHRQHNTSLYFWFGNVVSQKPDVIERMYQLLDDAGYSPQAYRVMRAQ